MVGEARDRTRTVHLTEDAFHVLFVQEVHVHDVQILLLLLLRLRSKQVMAEVAEVPQRIVHVTGHGFIVEVSDRGWISGRFYKRLQQGHFIA